GSGSALSLTNPGPELLHDRVLIDLVAQGHEADQVRRTDQRERQAGAARCVAAATGLERLEGQRRAVQAPHLGNTQDGIDAHAVQRTAGDVHLDGQVRRRVDTEVDTPFAADARLAGNPVAVVGLEAAPLP